LEYSVRILREKRIAILCFFCQKRGPGIVLFLLFDHKSTPGFLPPLFRRTPSGLILMSLAAI
ncbi:hypothetical protein, partial [Salmonella enterica]